MHTRCSVESVDKLPRSNWFCILGQLLAEAEKEISTLMIRHEETAAPTTPPQNSLLRGPVEDDRGEDALWVKLLDPIAKLPTNVGSRIRNRVIDALAANPPAWAAELLEYSISKNVYKGNASGPTKVSLHAASLLH